MNSDNNKGVSEKALQSYLKKIEQYSNLRLTPEKEKELFKKIEEKDVEKKKWDSSKAKKKLAKANLRLVINIIMYYKPKTKKLTLLDLIHEGNLGLFWAVEKYDRRSNYRFSTFATLVIRDTIFRVLEDEKR